MTDKGRELTSWIADVCKVLGLGEGETLVINARLEGKVLMTSVFGNSAIQRNWNRLVLDDEFPLTKSVILEGESVIVPDPKYGSLDADSAMVLKHWDEPAGCRVLEVGANSYRKRAYGYRR